MYIQGNPEYHYNDKFTGPFDRREALIGTSDPAAVSPELLAETEYGGTHYDIAGDWRSNFHAEVKKDERTSRY